MSKTRGFAESGMPGPLSATDRAANRPCRSQIISMSEPGGVYLITLSTILMMTGAIREESFNPTAKFEQATVERKDAEYSYNDGDLYYFMDPETYDMVPLNRDVLGDAFRFVKENTVCKLVSYKGSVFTVEVPNFMDLEVTETEPGLRGDTATNVTKPATLETGAEVKVPLFINTGDKIQIDTRTGEYIGRSKE